MAAHEDERRGGSRDRAGSGRDSRPGGASRDRTAGSGRVGGRSGDDRGGYRGRDDRGTGGFRGRDERGGSDRRSEDRGGYRGRDDRGTGGYRGRDDRGGSDRGGYRGRDDRASGGFRGRDERGGSDRRSEDRGGYRGRDERPAGGYRGRDERPAGGYRGRDERPAGGYRGRDERSAGGYRGRDERPAGEYRGRGDRREDDRGRFVGRGEDRRASERGGFVRRDDDRGAPRGRDDRGRDDRGGRDDRAGGGYRGRDDRAGGGYRGRDDRAGGGYRGRDDDRRGGDRRVAGRRDDRRDDRRDPAREDRRSPDGRPSTVWHNGRRYVGGTTTARNADRPSGVGNRGVGNRGAGNRAVGSRGTAPRADTTPHPEGARNPQGAPLEGTPERPVIPDWDASGASVSGGAGASLQADGERLQKVIAAAGVASRRVAENLIVEGRVTVNGEVVDALGRRVDPATDEIAVDGVPVQGDASRRYVLLNKPVGIVSSLQDERGRRDLSEFVDRYEERLFNVGRLDAETSGLLVLTNDGDLAHVLAHPSFGITKTYIAKVRGNVNPGTVQRLLDGVELEDGPIAADKVRLLESAKGESLVEITLHSGRNRIVRRMLEAVDHPVTDLVRRSFGPLHLGSLPVGKTRELSTVELGKLLRIAREARGSAQAGPDEESAD
ncbi:hypothetical protein GCM10009706_15150 [Curtobacterium citreum]|nr:hypothetical protein GCM10009706_15150 [Curtobacterium citreum]